MLRPVPLHLLLPLLFAAWTLSPAQAQAQTLPASNPTLVDSPWNHYHSTMAMQASSPLPGPASRRLALQISDFITDAGEPLGTSPWHVLGPNYYFDSATARAVWGVSLKWLYKYIIDGDRFELVDRFKLNEGFTSIGWNFFQLADARVVVPNPGGLRTVPASDPCYGTEPALLIFEEQFRSTGAPVQCTGKFEITQNLLQQHCGWSNWDRLTVGTGNTIMHNGHIGIHVNRTEPREAYLLIVDSDFAVKGCHLIGPGFNTNGAPSEPVTATRDAMYFALDTRMVKATFDAASGQFSRVWTREVGFRSGRTGSTPTLMGLGSEADRFVVAIDARCAVQNPFTGTIQCDADASPSRLVAIRRDTGEVIRHNLPEWLDTVECSPTVLGYQLAVSDYAGYSSVGEIIPPGETEPVPNFARGIVKVDWDESSQRFITRWEREDLQMSGVNTISGGTQMIYGSGGESDGFNYAYGLDLASGASVYRKRIGPVDAYFDAGNNVLINDDGSILWPAGESMIRLRDR